MSHGDSDAANTLDDSFEENGPAPGGSSWPGLPVLFGGLITTTLTMLGVYYLQMYADTHIMGWYANFVIPAGAILVGLAAGSGYGIASWLSGTKIGSVLMLTVLMLQVASYFSAQYFEYRYRFPQAPASFFPQYFDAVTRNWAWVDDNGQPGQPFGAWGYGMRALEITGFSLGGLVAPLILMAAPYCHQCGVYMKSKELGLLPGGIEPRKIKKKETEAQAQYETEIRDAMQAGAGIVGQMFEQVAAGDPQGVARILDEHKPNKKEINKSTSRYSTKLEHCPRCGEGQLVVSLVAGQGENMSTEEFARCPVDANVADALVQRKA